MGSDPSQDIDTAISNLGEASLPSDQPDELSKADLRSIEGTPTAQLRRELVRARKSAEGDRDAWRDRCETLQERANSYERLDDRRRGSWLVGLLAALTGVGTGLATMFPTNDPVRMFGGCLAIVAAMLVMLVAVRQGQKPNPSK